MKVNIDMGAAPKGAPADLDLEELLATRLLVQGNSGSGKSHLLRRLLGAPVEVILTLSRGEAPAVIDGLAESGLLEA